MNIIKLNAIDSTNSYLKKLVLKETIENFTVVVTEHQFLGRGQMGTTWESEEGKNLTYSILISVFDFKIKDQFNLSMAISLGVIDTLKNYIKVPLFVKWPNDILAGKDKIAGILIENMLKGNVINHSIVGIGLNVNQECFSGQIKNVTSIKKITGNDVDKSILLKELIFSIIKYVKMLENKDFVALKKLYLKSLFKYNIPAMFEDLSGTQFLGKIMDIAEDGRLEIELENEKTRKFNLKEIKFTSL